MALPKSLQGPGISHCQDWLGPCIIAPVSEIHPSYSQKCRIQEQCVCLEASPAVLSELPRRLHSCPLSLTLVHSVLSCGPP